MPPADTARLFEDMREGSDAAVAAFYERCARKLLPFIRLRMGRAMRQDVESRDVLQAVLLKSYQRISTVREPSAVMGWMIRIAENEIRDQADRQHRQKRDQARRAPLEAAADMPAPVRHALSLIIVGDRTERLERALETLPADERDLIVMRTLEERSFVEIGAALGKSPDACRMALGRAMAALTLAIAATS